MFQKIFFPKEGELLKEEVSVATLEGRLQQLKQDLDGLRINYMILPDMNAGKGYLQIAYAAADAPKLKAWYELYQKTMLSEGTSVKNIKEMSWEDYLKTAGKTPSGEKNHPTASESKAGRKKQYLCHRRKCHVEKKKTAISFIFSFLTFCVS